MHLRATRLVRACTERTLQGRYLCLKSVDCKANTRDSPCRVRPCTDNHPRCAPTKLFGCGTHSQPGCANKFTNSATRAPQNRAHVCCNVGPYFPFPRKRIGRAPGGNAGSAISTTPFLTRLERIDRGESQLSIGAFLIKNSDVLGG